MVEARADDDVFFAQDPVVAGDAGDDVMGSERVAALLLQAEGVAVPVAEQVQAVGGQGLGDVGGRLALTLGAGLAAFPGGGCEIADVLLHRGHGFAVLQRPVGRDVLGGSEQGQEEQQSGQDPFHGYSTLRTQASLGQKASERSRTSHAFAVVRSFVPHTATMVLPSLSGSNSTG